VTPRDLADGRLAAAVVATAIVGAVLIAGPYPRTAGAAAETPLSSLPTEEVPPELPTLVPATPTPDPWAETAERCGAGRWAVRTLGDDQLSRVDFGRVVAARIVDLASVRRPLAELPDDGRVGPLETTLFRVDARLLQARATPEGEVQVAVADATGSATLVVVMPGADCLARTPATLRTRAVSARDAFTAACGPFGPEWATVAGKARFVAPGYWASVDPARPTSNGLQLSTPVEIDVSGACGTPGSSPSAPTSPVSGG
jgi:hypothetical protein